MSNLAQKKFDYEQKKVAKKLGYFTKISYLCTVVKKMTSGNKICGITIEKFFLSALVSFS